MYKPFLFILFPVFLGLSGYGQAPQKDGQVFTVAKTKSPTAQTRIGYSILINDKELIGTPDSSGKITTVQCHLVKYRMPNSILEMDSAWMRENTTGKKCRIISCDYVFRANGQTFKGNSKGRSRIATMMLEFLKPKDKILFENFNLEKQSFVAPEQFVVTIY